MTPVRPALVQTAWAEAVVESLLAQGVLDIVVSPGSRSTPLLCAAACSRLRTTTIIDERCAAFFALGIARQNGAPVALLCTSGSAGAHYHPALVEASACGIPLIAMTADRPPELLHCAAPQTTIQRDLYGHHARASVTLGPATASRFREDLLRLRAALALCRGPAPGPVHLNLHFRKPLEPAVPNDSAEKSFIDALQTSIAPAEPRRADSSGDTSATSIAKRLDQAERPILVLGPPDASSRQAGAELDRFTAATNVLVLAEASSGFRFGALSHATHIDCFDWLLSTEEFPFDPDFIVEVGRPPTSKHYARYVASHPTTARAVITDSLDADPHHSAMAIMRGPVDDSVARVTSHLGAHSTRVDTNWRSALEVARGTVWRHVGQTCIPQDGAVLREGAACRAALSCLPSGTLVLLGNSLPVRTVDDYVPAELVDLDIACQRGVSGIDGLVSGAAGACYARRGATAVLLGDVSFTHDLGGLSCAQLATHPLVIIVIDNQGGRIFDHLPIAASDLGDELLTANFTTPPTLDFASLAGTFDIGYCRVATQGELSRAVKNASKKPQATIVHVIVEPKSAHQDRLRLEQTIAHALATEP